MKYFVFFLLVVGCQLSFGQCRNNTPLEKEEVDSFLSSKMHSFNIDKSVLEDVIGSKGYSSHYQAKEIFVFLKAIRSSEFLCKQKVLLFYKDTNRDINSDWKKSSEISTLVRITPNKEVCTNESDFENSISIDNITDFEILKIHNNFVKIMSSALFSRNVFHNLPHLIGLRSKNISSISKQNDSPNDIEVIFKADSWCGRFTLVTLSYVEGEFIVKSINRGII